MRMRLVKDVFSCTMQVQDLENASDVTVFLGTGVKLAVGESTGSAFSKAIVRIGLEFVVVLE